MAPALFFILLLSVGLRATFQYILYCALLQVGSWRLLRWWVTFADCSSCSLRCRFYSRILLLTLPVRSTSAVSSSTSGRSIGVWYPKISFSIVTFISVCYCCTWLFYSMSAVINGWSKLSLVRKQISIASVWIEIFDLWKICSTIIEVILYLMISSSLRCSIRTSSAFVFVVRFTISSTCGIITCCITCCGVRDHLAWSSEWSASFFFRCWYSPACLVCWSSAWSNSLGILIRRRWSVVCFCTCVTDTSWSNYWHRCNANRIRRKWRKWNDVRYFELKVGDKSSMIHRWMPFLTLMYPVS